MSEAPVLRLGLAQSYISPEIQQRRENNAKRLKNMRNMLRNMPPTPNLIHTGHTSLVSQSTGSGRRRRKTHRRRSHRRKTHRRKTHRRKSF